MVEFLQGKEDFVGQLLHHLGTSAIMDLLLRLITCIEAQDTRNLCISVSLHTSRSTLTGVLTVLVVLQQYSNVISCAFQAL